MSSSKNTYITKKIVLWVFFVIFAMLVVILLFGHKIAMHDPYLTDSSLTLMPPNMEYIFGCDHLGRDIFSRTILGMQSSLFLALVGVSIIFVIGTTLGVIAGYLGGAVNSIIMRFADMMLAFPGVVLSIAIVGVLGPGTFNTLLALVIPGWAEYARMTRALTIGEKEKEYIKTGILNGNNKAKIIAKYIIPNIMPQLIVYCALSVSSFILRFAGLAFLGLGFKPPRPEIGLMLSEAKDYMQVAPNYMLYPGIALFIIVFVFNILADILRDNSEKNVSIGGSLSGVFKRRKSIC
ncbi:MAG: ABC transporter permease [Aminipila sp.]